MKELGRRVRAKRSKMGLSQTELGVRVGRSHGQISNIEHGLTAAPPAELLTALARELGEDPAEFLRLAGRVNLAAEHVIPAVDDRPAWADELFRQVANIAARLDSAPIAKIEPPTTVPVGISSPWPTFIRLARTARGMSPGDLAVKMGTNARTVERWETGEGSPSLQQASRLLGVLAAADTETKQTRRRQTA